MDEAVCEAMLEKARVLFTEEPRNKVRKFLDSVLGNETRVQNVRRMVANAVERELSTTSARHRAADRFHLARRAGESNVIVFTLPIMQELAKVNSFDMELSVRMTELAEQIADLGKEVKRGRVSVDYFLGINTKSWDRLATMNSSLAELPEIQPNDGFPSPAWFDETRAKVEDFRKQRAIVLQFITDSRHDLSEVAAKVEKLDGGIQISGILEQGSSLLPVKADELTLLWFFHTAYRDSRIAREIWEESAEKDEDDEDDFELVAADNWPRAMSHLRRMHQTFVQDFLPSLKSLTIKIGTVQKYFADDLERGALDKEMATLEAYAEGKKGGRPATTTTRFDAKRAGWAVKAKSKIEHLARINKYEAIARELKRSIAALKLQVRNVSEVDQILAIADSAEDFREQPLESVRDTAAFAVFDKWRDMTALKALRESMKLVSCLPSFPEGYRFMIDVPI